LTDPAGAEQAPDAPDESTDGADVAVWLAEVCAVDVPADLALLAMTHRSYAYENGGGPTNERLEFLGDAVLGLAVTDALYRRFPDRPEGQLAPMRASIVNKRSLAEIARTIGVGPRLRLGHGEEVTAGREKSSILADAVEAIVGAVYLSSGMDVAERVVLNLVAPALERAADPKGTVDWKTVLQEICADLGFGPPIYEISETGPDHAKEFTAQVIVGGAPAGLGVGRNKKEAEQQAASQAVERFGGPVRPGRDGSDPTSAVTQAGN
jgi:ribonuclease III